MSAAHDTVLSVEGLVAGYGRIEALHGVSLTLRQGELVALVGANGAGKTTLLRTLSGLIPTRAGRVALLGQDITRWAPERRVAAGLAQVLEGRQVFGPLSVQDNLRLGAFAHRDAADERMRRMYDLFPVLKDKRDLPAGTLSGGQQQMLAMARALMSAPKVLLLDEPSEGIQPNIVHEIGELIPKLARQYGIAVLLVEQNLDLVAHTATRCLFMDKGRIVHAVPVSALSDENLLKNLLAL